MFPSEWTGREAIEWRGKVLPPSDMTKEKEMLTTKLLRCRDAEMAWQNVDSSSMSDDEYSNYQAKLAQLSDATIQAREQRDRFGGTYDTRLSDAEAFSRRTSVEEKLTNAIAGDELALVAMHGQSSPHPWRDFFKNPEFELNFPLSYMRLPEEYGGERRSAGFLRHEFDAWAAECEFETFEFWQGDLEERVISWFRLYKLIRAKNVEPIKRKDAEIACKEAFGNEFLGTVFNSTWSLFAGKELKKGGYRRDP